MTRRNTGRMSVLLLACMAIGAGNASAITLEEGTGALGSVNECSLRIDGVIEKGDNAKVADHIKAATSRFEFYPEVLRDKQYVVCLSGPGGNYLEGIEIAKTLSSLDVTTKVEDGQSCLSACAIAFLGGRFNSQSGEGYFPSRYLFPGSRLGFHAPQLTVPDADYSKDQVQKAYGLALDAITELNAASKDLFISPDLTAAIVRHRDNDFFFTETIDDLAHFRFDLAGYRKNAVRDDTRKAACWNAFNWKYIGANRRMSDEEWTNAFADTSTEDEKVPKGIFLFFPFDGPMFCRVSIPYPDAETLQIKVVLSQNRDMSDPAGEYYAEHTILYRGTRKIGETR